MNVGPLNLRQQKLKPSSGVSTQVEVTSSSVAVADDFEQALRETNRLRQDVARLEIIVRGHHNHLPPGRYLAIVKGDKKVLRRFRVVKK